jgi:hypothetical protein
VDGAGVDLDRSARRGVAVVARNDVAVQVRNRVAEDLEVHLGRPEDRLEGTRGAHQIVEERGAPVGRQVVRLGDVPATDDDAVARHRLVGAQPELADGQVGHDVAVLVAGRRRGQVSAERAALAPDQGVPLGARDPGGVRLGHGGAV